MPPVNQPNTTGALRPRDCQALLDAVHQLETAWREIPESSMPALADACRSANEALDEAVLHMCPQMIRK